MQKSEGHANEIPEKISLPTSVWLERIAKILHFKMAKPARKNPGNISYDFMEPRLYLPGI
jgi:hypothetical protein